MVNNSEEFHVVLIQSEPVWEDINANLSLLEEEIRKIDTSTDLVILPEMFTTGFSMQAAKLAEVHNGHTFRWMQLMAKHLQGWIMGSFIIKENHKFFNRLYALGPQNEFAFYDKRYLYSPAGENKAYTPGNTTTIINIKGWKILPLICYDLRFPEWSRNIPKEDQPFQFDIIVYCASWPAPRIHAWDTLLAARAIENQSYCIGVNRVGLDHNGLLYPGHSAIYDFKGQELYKMKDLKEVKKEVLQKEKLLTFRKNLPFWQDIV